MYGRMDRDGARHHRPHRHRGPDCHRDPRAPPVRGRYGGMLADRVVTPQERGPYGNVSTETSPERYSVSTRVGNSFGSSPNSRVARATIVSMLSTRALAFPAKLFHSVVTDLGNTTCEPFKFATN
jgi:hypothetical protein